MRDGSVGQVFGLYPNVEQMRGIYAMMDASYEEIVDALVVSQPWITDLPSVAREAFVTAMRIGTDHEATKLSIGSVLNAAVKIGEEVTIDRHALPEFEFEIVAITHDELTMRRIK